MPKRKVEVDLVEKQVRIGKKIYWYEYKDGDQDQMRLWFTKSKKYAYLSEDGEVDETKKILIKDIEDKESRGEGAFDWVRAKRRIKNSPRTLARLNRCIDRAEADNHTPSTKSKRSAESHSDHSKENRSTGKALQSGNQGKRVERHATLSFALKSAVSDYVLNLRVAPSKKRPDLHNFSVHLGSKFLAYIETSLDEIGELGRRLTNLK